MARPLSEMFPVVWATDIMDYGWDGMNQIHDFLDDRFLPPFDAPDWIVTNPPFNMAEEFLQRAYPLATEGVAFFVRTPFLETVGRYNRLFNVNPPNIIAQYAERVPIYKGRVVKKGSTAACYCWLVWIKGEQGTRFVWIPPQRKRFERESDYGIEA